MTYSTMPHITTFNICNNQRRTTRYFIRRKRQKT